MRALISVILVLLPFLLHAQAAEPTNPVSGVIRSIQNCDELRVNWTNGDGTARLIIMRSGAPVSVLPQDGIVYTANPQYGLGSNLGSNNFVVFAGSSNTTVLTGLQPNVNYHFAIFEYNGTGTNTNYLTSVYPAWNVPVPAAITTNATVTDASCFGLSDGTITLTINGGLAPYNLTWSNGDKGPQLQTLNAGQYTVTITDSLGCVVLDSFAVTEPDELTYTLTPTNVTCPEGKDGAIATQVIGGTPPYDFRWSTGAASPNLSQLAAGNYSLTLTDNKQCTLADTITITAPEPFTITADTSNLTCFDSEDGRISLSVSGGNGNYQYEWNDGATGPVIDQAASGLYNVTITDKEGCQTTAAYVLTAPEPITVGAQVIDVSCAGNEDGSISVSAAGGAGGYTYDWSTGSMDPVITALATGQYTITVTDRTGCTASKDFTIDVIDDPRGCLKSIKIFELFTPNGDGINDTWVIEGLQNYPDNSIQIFNRWGQQVYEVSPYNNDWQGTTTDGKSLPQGTYYYILTLYTTEAIQLAGDITFMR